MADIKNTLQRANKVSAKTTGETWYHGTALNNNFKQFSEDSRHTGNAGKGTYLTNDPGAAKYYSYLSETASQLRSKKPGDLTAVQPRLGKVLKASIPANARIKTFTRMPTREETAAIKSAGYHGFSYPDETFNYTEDWPHDLINVKEFPKNPRAMVMFNAKHVKIH